MAMPDISVRKVEIRDDRLDVPITALIVTLEDAGRVWVEQFTEVRDAQIFLQGVKASFGMLGQHVELPLVATFAGGTVQVENPGRVCPFCEGRGSTLAAVADRDASLYCDQCAGTGRLKDRG